MNRPPEDTKRSLFLGFNPEVPAEYLIMGAMGIAESDKNHPDIMVTNIFSPKKGHLREYSDPSPISVRIGAHDQIYHCGFDVSLDRISEDAEEAGRQVDSIAGLCTSMLMLFFQAVNNSPPDVTFSSGLKKSLKETMVNNMNGTGDAGKKLMIEYISTPPEVFFTAFDPELPAGEGSSPLKLPLDALVDPYYTLPPNMKILVMSYKLGGAARSIDTGTDVLTEVVGRLQEYSAAAQPFAVKGDYKGAAEQFNEWLRESNEIIEVYQAMFDNESIQAYRHLSREVLNVSLVYCAIGIMETVKNMRRICGMDYEKEEAAEARGQEVLDDAIHNLINAMNRFYDLGVRERSAGDNLLLSRTPNRTLPAGTVLPIKPDDGPDDRTDYKQ